MEHVFWDEKRRLKKDLQIRVFLERDLQLQQKQNKMKTLIAIFIAMAPLLLAAQPLPADTTHEPNPRGNSNPFVTDSTKNVIDQDYINTHKTAALLDLTNTNAPKSRGGGCTSTPHQTMDLKQLVSGLDTLNRTGTQSIFTPTKK